MKYGIFITLTLIWIVRGLIQDKNDHRHQWFIAAVYEHIDNSSTEESLSQRMMSNVAIYKTQALKAAALGAYMLVFPEYGITGVPLPSSRKLIRPYFQVIPSLKVDISQEWTPCEEPDTGFNVTVIRRLSCIAKETGVVLVVNLGTVLPCDNDGETTASMSCPEDNLYYFNTDIVFNENGTVLALYHKINLYLEPLFDSPPYAAHEVITFQTPYGRFGLITCFDIIWKHPLITLVKDHDIQHIAFPTAWIDGLPFLTSIQSQLSWSIGLNITLIAANLHNLRDDRGGSGIYSGNYGIMNYTYGSLSEGRLLTANISDEPNQHNRNKQNNTKINYDGIIYDDMSNYTFQLLNVTEENLEGSVQGSSNTFSCHAEYKFNSTVDNGQYYLIIYKGNMTAGEATYSFGVELCIVAFCTDGDPHQTCARPPVTSNANITFINLKANFSTQFLYPSILNHDVDVIDTSLWTFTKTPIDSCCNHYCLESNIEHCDKKLSDIGAEQIAAQLTTNAEFFDRPLVTAIFGRIYNEY